MTVRDLILALMFAVLADLIGDWLTKLSRWLAKCAARGLPRTCRARWQEDWLADLEACPRLARPLYALGLFRAAIGIRREYFGAALIAPPFSDDEGIASDDKAIAVEFNDFSLAEFVKVAGNYGQERYGFVVFPTVDRLIRYYQDPVFRAQCRGAEFTLLDIPWWLRYLLPEGVKRPVRCSSMDITALLLTCVANSGDRIILIGVTSPQVSHLAETLGLPNLSHYNPATDFTDDPAELEKCLRFIETASPFRFCFLNLGCPAQEMIAQALRKRGIARGLSLCVGAPDQFRD
jgi:N-acetylglucosaminyldiphosphoundecaprenol N-acetyl-beta-D-mannosaminyltransferase